MEPSPSPEIGQEIQTEISPDGVDISLIRWMLSLTPMERLETLQDFVDGALALRDGRVGD
jgi:hypothetical protein